MRRTSPIMMIVAAVSLMPLMYARSQTQADSRTAPRLATIKRIQVSAQTIKALSRGKKYVVDLTQRGVKYEFDPNAGQIDFSRVIVRTPRGDVTMASFLERIIPKDKLAGFKYTSQSFSLGTRPPGTLQTPPTKIVVCLPDKCMCSGKDCDTFFDSGDCRDDASFCATNFLTGEMVCSCIRKSAP